MNNVMISIAMTTFNGERYLREQIESIISQTVTDWELIVCDDCSSDSTWSILTEFSNKDKRIKLFSNKENLGFKKNFSKAVELCTGKYIALSDQDDIWAKNHLEILLKNIDGKSVSAGNALLVDKDGISLKRKHNEVRGFDFFMEQKFLYRELLLDNPIQGASMLLDAEFSKRCVPIPEKVKYHDTWFATCACFDKGISYTYEIVTYYRQHGDNITFKDHNKDTRSFFEKLFSKINVLIKGSFTDRFNYIEELSCRYKITNNDFEKIKTFVSHIERNRISVKDIVWLWKNYYFIVTQKTHKFFLKHLLIWSKWKRII